MKKNYVCLVSVTLITLLFCVSVTAKEAAVIVKFKDTSVKTYCVSIGDSATAKDALDATGLSLKWQGAGEMTMLMSVEGASSDYSHDEAWAFWTNDGNGFEPAQVGFGAYDMQDYDVIGLGYSKYDSNFNFINPPSYKSFAEICPKLSIKDLEIKVDGKRRSSSKTGDSFKVAPGAKVKVSVTLENIYPSSSDSDIEGIYIESRVDDVNGEDIEESTDEKDISAGSKKSFDLEFTLPTVLDSDEFDLELVIYGQDPTGIEYEKKIIYELNVDREKHDILINDISSTPDKISCNNNAELSLTLINNGEEDEDISLSIASADLSISKSETISLDQSDSIKKSYSFSFNNIGEGSYPVTITAQYSGTTVEETINLIKLPCATETSAVREETKNNDVQVTQGYLSNPVQTSSAQFESRAVAYHEESKMPYIVLAILGLGILIALTIALSIRK